MADFIRVGEMYSIGLSTDTKLTGVPAGHIAHELDTGKITITRDGGVVYDDVPGQASGAGTAVIGEVGVTGLGEVQASPTANTVLARLKTVGDQLDITTSDLRDAIKEYLSRVTEVAIDAGTATGGSTSTIADISKNWEVNKWTGSVVEVVVDGIHYYRTVQSNTSNEITFDPVTGTAVSAGDDYAIRSQLKLADIDKWGGTSLTGRDVSEDFRALTDDTIKGVLRSLSDVGVAAGEDDMGLLERLGEIKATPTANTVLGRLKDLLTGIVLSAGSAIIGKVGIDQTTPGTTNGVQVNAALPIGSNRIGKTTVRNAADSADIDPVAEGTFTDRVGEVQATPTSNTVLARLKDLLTGIVLSAGTALIGKVGIDQVTANANEVVVKSGTITAVTGITNALPAGGNVIGGVNPPALTITVNPFGKGNLTTDGVQYSTEVTGVDHTAFGAVETVTIDNPTGYEIEEITFGLTMAVASSDATKYVKWKFQASDDGTTWVDLIAEQTRAANASAYLDVSVSGRFPPVANFLLTSATFQIRGVIQAEDATETVKGKAKNSSWIQMKYRRA